MLPIYITLTVNVYAQNSYSMSALDGFSTIFEEEKSTTVDPP